MKYDELVKKLRDLHRDPRPSSAVWVFDNQVALYDAAAAIESLQAEQKKTVTQIFCEEQAAWEGRCKDLMKQISELQAEVNGLIADAGARIGKAEADRPHWVSVEERLPEVDVNVLVYAIGKIDGFIGETVIALTRMSDTNRLNHHEKVDKPYWLDPWQYFLTDYRITHWMPLPEPPREVQE